MNIIIKNITEKKRLESIAQQLELMNNLGMVFSTLRHEIGNPMNSIKMTATVLKENINKYSHQKIHEYMERIVEELNRVEFLLQNLKSFSMWEDCRLRNVKIHNFIREFQKLVQNDLNENGIDVHISIDQNLDNVYTDPRALHQVLLNVVNNAKDALHKQKTPLLNIDVSLNQGRVRILVEDNGRGIPKTEKMNLFNPFFTTKKNGTGLGLLITRKILSRLTGTIEIKSEVYKGTKVVITLPEGKLD